MADNQELCSCLDNKAQIDSVVSNQEQISSQINQSEQIKSDMSSLLTVSRSYSSGDSDNIDLDIDNNKNIITANIKQVQFDSANNFPEIGSDRLIYVDKSQNTPYRWDSETNSYKSLGKDLSDEFGALEKRIDDIEDNSIKNIFVNAETSVGEDKNANINIELKKDPNSDLTYYLDVNGKKAGEINIPKDQFLKSATYNPDTDSLEFVFETTNGEQKTVVDMSDLVDVYTAGNGLTLVNNQFSIKVSPDSTEVLSVSENGLKLDLSNYVDLSSQQRLSNKEFDSIDIIAENVVPVYENQEATYNYEYTIENLSTDYGFELNENGYYESNNKGKDNTYCLCKLSFNMWVDGDLTFEVINSGESNYDFGIFSNLDQTLSSSYNEDTSTTLVYKSYKGLSSTIPVTLTYTAVPAGEHFITIKFKKDSSSSQGNDSLQFKVLSPIGEVTIITPVIVGYEDYIGNIDIDSDKDLTYNNEKVITDKRFKEVENELPNKVSSSDIKTFTVWTVYPDNYTVSGNSMKWKGGITDYSSTFNPIGTSNSSVGGNNDNASLISRATFDKLVAIHNNLVGEIEQIYNQGYLKSIPTATEESVGGIRIWAEGDTLYISTSYYDNIVKDNTLQISGAYKTILNRNTISVN